MILSQETLAAAPPSFMKLLSRDPKSLFEWASHRAIWFYGRPLSISDHNFFILLAMPDLGDYKGVWLQHFAYDTDWELQGSALQWDGPYSGWSAVHVT